MFRAEQPRTGSVAELVAKIEAISVDELSVKGRNAQTDTHYYHTWQEPSPLPRLIRTFLSREESILC
jgi:hypothetical protein